MSFKIDFLEDKIPVEKLQSSDEAVWAQVVIGDFAERLEVPLNYWQQDDYKRQWADALSKILSGNYSKTALITSMCNPDKPDYAITIWPLYRVGNDVFVHNQWLQIQEFGSPFELENFYKKLDDRQTKTDDGQPISEWKTNVKDLAEWLKLLS
jgi:hypothetical protein